MKIETLKVLTISTGHITKEDKDLLVERSYNSHNPESPSPYDFMPATDAYGHWIEAGDHTNEGECECRCAAADDEGYSSYFIDILRLAQNNQCSYVRFDFDGPEYRDLSLLNW